MLSDVDCLLIEYLIKCEVRLALLCMICSKIFDFFSKSLGEDSYILVFYGNYMLVSVEDFILEYLLKEGGIISFILWTRRTIDS